MCRLRFYQQYFIIILIIIIITLVQFSINIDLSKVTEKDCQAMNGSRMEALCWYHQQNNLHSNEISNNWLKFYNGTLVNDIKNNIVEHFAPARTIIHVYNYRQVYFNPYALLYHFENL
ncbi:unnamed protein product [Rotaria socialis]|uniref:Uncharacterized protein n=2 Tax=Rotaria socialis TaxID=392032 RepID=A0A818XCP3_9BILA|nr:unnamed protein product [Rotaria socialis]CAF3735504.1 unnamed protein product [Rotaria socialis]